GHQLVEHGALGLAIGGVIARGQLFGYCLASPHVQSHANDEIREKPEYQEPRKRRFPSEATYRPARRMLCEATYRSTRRFFTSQRAVLFGSRFAGRMGTVPRKRHSH